MAEASDAAQQDMGALSGRFGYVSEKTVAVVTGGELMVVLAKQDGAFAGFVGIGYDFQEALPQTVSSAGSPAGVDPMEVEFGAARKFPLDVQTAVRAFRQVDDISRQARWEEYFVHSAW